MDVLDKIYDMVCCELDDISKKDRMTMQDLDAVDKLVDIIKDIEGMNDGVQYNRTVNRSSYDNTTTREESKKHMLAQLEQVMNMAVDDRDKKAVEKLMSQMMNN